MWAWLVLDYYTADSKCPNVEVWNFQTGLNLKWFKFNFSEWFHFLISTYFSWYVTSPDSKGNFPFKLFVFFLSLKAVLQLLCKWPIGPCPAGKGISLPRLLPQILARNFHFLSETSCRSLRGCSETQTIRISPVLISMQESHPENWCPGWSVQSGHYWVPGNSLQQAWLGFVLFYNFYFYLYLKAEK